MLQSPLSGAVFFLSSALVACAPDSLPLETALELGTVERSLPLMQPVDSPYPQIEVQSDGSLLLNGELFSGPGREFRKALEALLKELPRVEDDQIERPYFVCTEMYAVPFILLAASDTPYAHIRNTLQTLQYKGLQVWDLLLAVRRPGEVIPSALHVNLAQDFGITCTPVGEVVTQLDWFKHLRNERVASASPANALRITRVDSFRTDSRDDSPPTIVEHPPIHGPALGQWLREYEKANDAITFETQETAIWQDVLALLELCMANDIDFVGDFRLHPTLDVWDPSRLEPDEWWKPKDSD